MACVYTQTHSYVHACVRTHTHKHMLLKGVGENPVYIHSVLQKIFEIETFCQI